MQCEQIQGYLTEYAAGQLPSYKAAWTAQHLAGCESCREQLEGLRSRPGERQAFMHGPEEAPVAATVDSVGRIRRSGSVSVQRPVPRLLRSITAVSLLGLIGGAAWLVLVYARTGW